MAGDSMSQFQPWWKPEAGPKSLAGREDRVQYAVRLVCFSGL